jgi:hypothetical protein
MKCVELHDLPKMEYVELPNLSEMEWKIRYEQSPFMLPCWLFDFNYSVRHIK